MSGNTFTNSIIISGGGGGGYNVLSGSPVNAPTITNNAYNNYAGSAISSGGSYSDANPVSEDPKFLCGSGQYLIAKGSPVFSSPISFSGLPSHWGPPGFVIPQTGTPPSPPCPQAIGDTNIEPNHTDNSGFNTVFGSSTSVGFTTTSPQTITNMSMFTYSGASLGNIFQLD